MSTFYEQQYDPTVTLKHPEFKLLTPNDVLAKGANIACSYNEKHELHLMNKPMPKPRKGEVIVHVKASGICGSDVHFWKHGHIGPTMVVRDTCGAGHESSGEVIELGEGVTGFEIGDKVAIEAGVPCGLASCEGCRSGRYNACPNVVFFSTPPYHGLLTRYHAHPAAWLHKMPPSMSFEEGALCEPLCVALAGIERANLRLGDPILICGAGPIGVITAISARAAGATPIVITDLFDSRLEFARKVCPGIKTLKIEREWSPLEVAEKIKALSGEVIKIAFECTGVESSIEGAIYSLGFGGHAFVIGVGKPVQTYPFMYCSANEITLDFQYRYANQYPKAIRLVSSGLIDLKPLVTHRFPLEKAIDAFHTAADPTTGCVKVQILD